ncbi:uncharacterized protein LOC107274039 isoform X2 [Cephus cinctus]|uniref:Uncharacterized protein LOC107274039 isoform X2 n=1 Tax=Cephus cinctus TaxID=211228 RepID=A0AAJ7CEK7_CEPCN|nr:uncharacterized protein LOC107274039 isoform X2 [Cephus cinctus]
MRPSTLSVVAIVCVAMAATTEAENGAIEYDINHQRRSTRTENEVEEHTPTVLVASTGNQTEGGSDQDDRYPKKETTAATEILVREISPGKNTSGDGYANVDSSEREERLSEDPLAIPAGKRVPADLEEEIPQLPVLEYHLEDSSNDVMGTKDRSEVPTATLYVTFGSVGPHHVTSVRQDERTANGLASPSAASVATAATGATTAGTMTTSGIPTTSSYMETSNGTLILIEEAVGEMAVEDIRAISFQVPSSRDITDFNNDNGNPRRIKSSRKLGESYSIDGIREESNPSVVQQVNSKSTKAFYEIRPSLNTEIDKAHPKGSSATTQRTFGRFVLPSVASAVGKFGPYFEDEHEEINVTARIGSTVLLDCKIGMLGDKMVTWLQHTKDSIRLLTVGRKPYSVDQRISLNFRYPSNWRLQILYASLRDTGLYKCQVATHPPLVKRINVIVTAPILTILDEAGRIIAGERHLKAGSALKLKCEARDVIESQNESVVWTRGDETLTEDVSENRTTYASTGMEVQAVVSTLVVEKATPRHAGNYSCVVPGRAKTTIAIHVLNGELPAAVHDGSGVSRAVLNLWLIHLTMSYVFCR